MANQAQQLSSLRVEAEFAGGTKFVSSAQAVARSMDEVQASVAAAGGALGNSETRLVRSSSGYEKLARSIDPAYRAQQQYTKGETILQRELDRGNISIDLHAQRMAQLGKQYTFAGGQVTGFVTTATRGVAGARNIGNAVQQAGYQVGDFAVQIASGQGVLRPFIQQGTQLVSMFGPWGAVIGAAGAVVGALATGLMGAGSAAGTATTAFDLLDKATKSLDDVMKNANETSRQKAFWDLRSAEGAAAIAASELEAADAILSRAKAQLDTASMFPDATGLSAGVATSMSDVVGAQKKLDEAGGKLDELRFAIAKLRGDMQGLNTDFATQVAANDALIAAAKISTHEYNVVALTQEMVKGKFVGTTEAARQQAEKLITQKEALEKLTGAAKSHTKETERDGKNARESLDVIEAQTKSTLELASAYGVSTEAGLRAQAALQARQAKVKNASVDEDALTADILKQMAANQALAASQALVTAKLDTQMAAARAGAAAMTDPNLQHQAEMQIARQEKLNQLQRDYALELERIPDLMAEFDRKQAYDDTARYYSDITKLAQGYATDVKEFIVDGLSGALNNGKALWTNVWDAALAGGKRFLYNFAAELATQKFVMPILMDVVGSNSSLFGIVQQAAGVSGGAGGTSGSMGGLGSLSNLSTIASLFSKDGFIAQGANWASNVLGFGSIIGGATTATAAAQAAGTVGAHAAPYVASATGAGAGGSLTGAASGASSGLAAIPVWGWVAMAVIAAKQFTQGASPTSAKGTLNTLLMPSHEEWQANPRRAIANLDPVGLALTDHGLPSWLTPGGLVNKWLGNTKPSNEGSAYVVQGMGAKSGPYYDPDEYSQPNTDAALGLADAFTQLRDEIISVTGGTFDKKVQLNVGSRDGVYAEVGGASTRVNSLEAALDFLINGLAKGITGVVDADYKRILAMGGSAEDIYTNLSIAKQVKSLSQDGDIVAASSQLADLVDSFDKLRAKAVALGLAVIDLDKAQAAQLRDTRTNVQMNFSSTVHQFIDQFLTPLEELQASITTSGATTYDKFLAAQSLFRDVAARAAQGNQVALTMLASAGQTYADLARNLASTAQPLRDFLESLNGGELSNLTPRAQLDAAQGKFETLGARAAAGDASVMSDLQNAAQNYLQLAREYGASGKVYQDAYAEVTGALTSIVAGIDGAVASIDPQAVLSEVGAAIAPLIDELKASQAMLLAGIEPTLADLDYNFRTQIATMKDEGVQTRALLAEISAALGKVPGHSKGGPVNGRGTGTSDDNLRWLSAGEYVSTASTVARRGVGFFDKLEQGYLPVTGVASNDNRSVVDAIFTVGQAHAKILSELVASMGRLEKENAELRRDLRNATNKSQLQRAS